MAKIDLIIENIRDEYMINLLEESEVSELEALKTKRFLNESLGRIRSMLVEEGAMDAVKSHLANNWGKYLAGGLTGAAMYHGADELTGGQAGLAAQAYPDAVANAYDQGGLPEAGAVAVGAPAIAAGYGAGDALQTAGEAIGGAAEQAGQGLQQIGDKLVDAAGNIYNQAGEVIGNMADQAGEAIGNAAEAAKGAIGNVAEAAKGAVGM